MTCRASCRSLAAKRCGASWRPSTAAGALEWLAIEADAPPAAVAQRAAKRLLANGHVAGVVALYPAIREIAVAMAFGEATALTVSLDAPDPVALAALRRLRSATASCATACAARAADILGGRGVGHEFFCQFRATLESTAAGITSPVFLSGRDRRTLALVQLTRVLFLYFVQSKGWLDGREDFLATAVDDCLARGRGLQRQLFDPLFFGTLNRPKVERSRKVAAFGRIPFLNGGLFEPHPLERRLHPQLADVLWRDAFDSLFERFHFTVSETDVQSPSIAPDMLGRVFEGVMAPADRKATGTFYTPAALVLGLFDAVCAAAVAADRGWSDAEGAALLATGDRAALESVTRYRVLDPACGSGAFLLGALERLAGYRVALGERAADARRSVLRRNLFGVDLDAIAVRLAELRLWLAVVADDPSDAGGTLPLPNLDCLVRQGDTLFAPIGSGVPASGPPAERMRGIREALTIATGPEKRSLTLELRSLELAAATEACGTEERHLEQHARELIGAARTPDLFGRKVRLGRALRAALSNTRSALRAVRTARRRLTATGEVPWFHYESAFADVFCGGGFDIVIGNPPWVRAEELPRAQRDRLSARYRWWRSGGTHGFAHRPDLSVAFLERAHELVRPGGAVAMLVPAKLLTAGYGTAARGALASTTTLHAVADLTHDVRAEFGATVYPLALVTTRRTPSATHHARVELEPSKKPRVAQRTLGPASWTMNAAAGVMERLRSQLPRFGDRFRCSLGVKTGADAVFLDPPEVEPELLRWAVRGRDLRDFRVRPMRRILWTHDLTGRPLDRLPPAASRYVAAHERRLLERADYVGGPPWTVFRVSGACAPHRVIWSDLAPTLTAAQLVGDCATFVPLNTCYVARTRTATAAHAAAAWLNSTWIRSLARAAATPASAGYARFSAATVRDLPLFPPDLASDLARLGRAAARGRRIREPLDDLVASALRLSRQERGVLAELAAAAPHRR